MVASSFAPPTSKQTQYTDIRLGCHDIIPMSDHVSDQDMYNNMKALTVLLEKRVALFVP